jgi:hypothetical protein
LFLQQDHIGAWVEPLPALASVTTSQDQHRTQGSGVL